MWLIAAEEGARSQRSDVACFHWVSWVHAVPLWWATFSVQTAEEARECACWWAWPLTIHQPQPAPSDLLLCWEKREHKNMCLGVLCLFMWEETEKGNWLGDWNKPTNQRRAKGEQKRNGQNLRKNIFQTLMKFSPYVLCSEKQTSGLIWHCW